MDRKRNEVNMNWMEMIQLKSYSGLDRDGAVAAFQKLNLSGKDWEDMVNLMSRHPVVKQMTGHPNEADVANAKVCARVVLG